MGSTCEQIFHDISVSLKCVVQPVPSFDCVKLCVAVFVMLGNARGDAVGTDDWGPHNLLKQTQVGSVRNPIIIYCEVCTR